MAGIGRKKPIKLRRGGDMHSVMVRIVGAGGYGETWVNTDLVCASLTRSYRSKAIERLAKKGWVAQLGTVTQATSEGLLALERAS